MTRATTKIAVATSGPRMLNVAIEGIPPTNNHAYKHITLRAKGSGQPYTARRLTDEAQGWRDAATLAVKLAKGRAGFDVTKRQPLAVEITYGVPALYLQDLDNLLKLAVDALALGLAWDDRYLTDLTVRKRRADTAETLITVIKLEAQT